MTQHYILLYPALWIHFGSVFDHYYITKLPLKYSGLTNLGVTNLFWSPDSSGLFAHSAVLSRMSGHLNPSPILSLFF